MTGYASSWLRQALSTRLASEKQTYDPFEELNRYLRSPLAAEGVDAVAWWGVRCAIYRAFYGSHCLYIASF